jgi:hypothetical protein
MQHSNQGIETDDKGQEQPVDKERAQAAHQSGSGSSPTREGTRDPKLSDNARSPGSGMTPDDSGKAPSD